VGYARITKLNPKEIEKNPKNLRIMKVKVKLCVREKHKIRTNKIISYIFTFDIIMREMRCMWRIM